MPAAWSSFSLTAVKVARVAAPASRIWPAPPLVSETTRTSAPALAYLARVPPAQRVSSSGWAKTPSTRGGRRPDAFTEELCAKRRPRLQPCSDASYGKVVGWRLQPDRWTTCWPTRASPRRPPSGAGRPGTSASRREPARRQPLSTWGSDPLTRETPRPWSRSSRSAANPVPPRVAAPCRVSGGPRRAPEEDARRSREATMDTTLCPECGALAEVQRRDVMESTDGPVEHAKDQLRTPTLVPAAVGVARAAATGGACAERGTGSLKPPGPTVSAMTVRVVFADDNYLVREGVAGLLAEADEVDLVETVADPAALLEPVAEHRPDAVLTDIRMPPTFTTEGIDAAKRIRAELPGDGRRGAVAVRRGGLRLRAALRRRGRARLPAQGAGDRRSTSWSGRCTTWPGAGRRSTRRSSRGCCARKATETQLGRCSGSPSASSRCSRSWRPAAATRRPPRRCS